MHRDGDAVRVLGEREHPARQGAGAAGGERGATMIFVLMAILLVGAVTISVMQVISGDVGGGIEAVEADQVFNIAQAGAHYVIGKLQLAGTPQNYPGETVPVTNGSTALGTATVSVSCIQTGQAPISTGCSGAYPGFRRIVSIGTLPVSGPSRTIVAVVQGTPSGGGSGNWSTGVCALGSITNDTRGGDTTTIHSDIVSNGPLNLTPPAGGGTVTVLGDPGPPPATGKLSAVGTVTCGAGCSAAGGVSGGNPGPLCSAPTLPTFTPGATDYTEAAGTTYTINSGTGYSFRNFSVSGGTCSGVTPMTTLQIQAGAAGTTTVVQFNTLTMSSCTRLVILGAGNIDMRIGATTGLALDINPYKTNGNPVHFGVTSADTFSTPMPVPASQLTVWVQSDGNIPGGTSLCKQVNSDPVSTSCAARLSHSSGGATVIVPNGLVQIDDSASPNPMKGAVLGNQVAFSGNGTFTQDVSGLSSFSSGATYTNFKRLMSWKDQ